MPNGAQLHLLVNHLPIVGFLLMTAVFLLAMLSRRTDYKRLALLGMTIIGLFALPAFFTGEPAEDIVEKLPGITKAQIEEHEEAGDKGLALSLATSAISLAVWFASRKNESLLNKGMPAVFAAAVFTTMCMAWVGHEGGKIHHPEISEH